MRVLNKESNDETTLYTVRMGYNELEILYALVQDAYLKLPKGMVELIPLRGRMNNMKKVLSKEVREYRKEHGGKYEPKRYIDISSKKFRKS